MVTLLVPVDELLSVTVRVYVFVVVGEAMNEAEVLTTEVPSLHEYVKGEHPPVIVELKVVEPPTHNDVLVALEVTVGEPPPSAILALPVAEHPSEPVAVSV